MTRLPSCLVAAGILVAACCLGEAVLPRCRAADPPAEARSGLFDVADGWNRLRQGWAPKKTPEIVEMFQAIVKGSQMGPGDGWFHPGQTRFGWPWLAARHGIEPRGMIEREKFQGPPEILQRLDRNRDGVLDAADFDWSERSPYFRQAGLASMWYSMVDSNSNGRISRAEWDAYFTRIARDKEFLTPDDLREALTPPSPPRNAPPPRSGAPTPAVLLKGLFHGELGSFFEGPNLGDLAPGFTLKTHDGKKDISLSQYRGNKPVVLIFGNFT
jgi:hypothetical protein